MKKLKELLKEFTITGMVNRGPAKKIELAKGWAHVVTERDDDGKALKEGPSYEYANYMKKIEKAENIQAKEVNNLVKLLTKKGLKKEATLLGAKYLKGVRDFDSFLKDLYGKLT